MLRICSRFALFALLLAAAPLSADVSGIVRVIDGDGIHVGATNVRLYGIDAPERSQLCHRADGTPWRCGAHVRQVLIDRYEGKRAHCIENGRDRYDRVLGICEVDGVNINRALVSDGWAFAYRKYSMMFDLDEKSALIGERGLHATRIEAPALYRQSRQAGAPGATPPDTECVIKGNVSRNGGERIYHRPGQRDYDRTRINEAKGERWFCTADEARAAGWRAALR